MATEQISVRLETELTAWLRRHAEAESNTLAGIVRKALREYRASLPEPEGGGE